MLFSIRRLLRPLATLTFLGLIAPGAAIDCLEWSAAVGEPMSCCEPSSQGSGLMPECCAVDESQPASEPPASTAPSARTSSHALPVPAVLPTLNMPLSDGRAPAPSFADRGSPPDRLYIRYAVIRR